MKYYIELLYDINKVMKCWKHVALTETCGFAGSGYKFTNATQHYFKAL